jgi:hypothetical protein
MLCYRLLFLFVFFFFLVVVVGFLCAQLCWAAGFWVVFFVWVVVWGFVWLWLWALFLMLVVAGCGLVEGFFLSCNIWASGLYRSGYNKALEQ